MLLLDPTYDLASIKPVERYKRNPLFERGDCFPAALAVLRHAPAPLTSKEIATRLLQDRGVAHMVGAVHTSLRNHQRDVVERIDGVPVRWRLRG